MAIRRETHVPNLCPCTIAILLRGWCVDPPVPCGDEAHPGFLDLYTHEESVGIWRQHESYLRDVARRWGWAPTVEVPDGRRMFVAEAVVAGVLSEL